MPLEGDVIPSPKSPIAEEVICFLLLHFLIILVGGSSRLLVQGQCKNNVLHQNDKLYNCIIQKKKRDTIQTYTNNTNVVQDAVVEAKAKRQRFHLHWKHNLL